MMRALAFVVLVSTLSVGAACSDSTEVLLADASVSTDGGSSAVDGSALPLDDAGDSGAASPLPVLGTLQLKQAGGNPTTMALGTFAVNEVNAQYRPKPNGGGTLTVNILEGTSKLPGREIEVTLHDDADAIDPKEAFAADSAGSSAPHRARVELYQAGSSRNWRTDGDGQVVVESISATAVTLTFHDVSQVVAGGGTDVFLVSGTVTVPISKLKVTASGTATFPFSNIQPEPITGELFNGAAPDKSFSCPLTTMSESQYPFVGTWRTLWCDDVQGGTSRHLRIAFPSGHLPHEGQTLPLDAFDRIQIFYFEGPPVMTEAQTEKRWQADQGTVVVQLRDWRYLRLELNSVRMQSESPSAKGTFLWNGPINVMTWLP